MILGVDAGLAIVRRDALVYLSYGNRLVSQVVVSFLGLVLFYHLSRLVQVRRFPTPDVYFAYVVVGLVILQVLTATLATLPGAVRAELVAGTFERLVVSPLGPAASIVAMAIWPIASAFFVGLVTMVMAVLVFGLDLTWSTAPLAPLVAALGACAFLPFAVVVATLVLLAKQAGSIGALVVIGLSLAGGVYFPGTLMPEWIRWISDVQPFTPALELLRHLLVGAELEGSAWADVGRLVAFAAIGLPVAYAVLRAGVAACRRRGTLIEY